MDHLGVRRHRERDAGRRAGRGRRSGAGRHPRRHRPEGVDDDGGLRARLARQGHAELPEASPAAARQVSTATAARSSACPRRRCAGPACRRSPSGRACPSSTVRWRRGPGPRPRRTNASWWWPPTRPPARRTRTSRSPTASAIDRSRRRCRRGYAGPGRAWPSAIWSPARGAAGLPGGQLGGGVPRGVGDLARLAHWGRGRAPAGASPDRGRARIRARARRRTVRRYPACRLQSHASQAPAPARVNRVAGGTHVLVLWGPTDRRSHRASSVRAHPAIRAPRGPNACPR